jgi:cellulose synthase/poly-beta-1,6-N-acetylglucosamine synthase-like glycosyltransferase
MVIWWQRRTRIIRKSRCTLRCCSKLPSLLSALCSLFFALFSLISAMYSLVCAFSALCSLLSPISSLLSALCFQLSCLCSLLFSLCSLLSALYSLRRRDDSKQLHLCSLLLYIDQGWWWQPHPLGLEHSQRGCLTLSYMHINSYVLMICLFAYKIS